MSALQTGWREYIGISRTTTTNGTTQVIECFVPEFLPNFEKDLPTFETKKGCITDPFTGCTKCATLTWTESVTCAFLGWHNKIVPCVAKGERVRVLNYCGTEQYYWMPMGRDAGIRKRERVRWFAMAQPVAITGKDQYETVTDENTYFIEMNTNPGEKELHIHTSVKDGEPFTYDMRIMPEKGIWEFIDSEGNVLRLNTFEHWWYMRNVDDSICELHKENINITCKDTMTINADKHIYVTTPDYHLTASKQTIKGDMRSATLSKFDSFTTNMYGIVASQSYGLSTNDAAYLANNAHVFGGGNFTVSTGTRWV